MIFQAIGKQRKGKFQLYLAKKNFQLINKECDVLFAFFLNSNTFLNDSFKNVSTQRQLIKKVFFLQRLAYLILNVSFIFWKRQFIALNNIWTQTLHRVCTRITLFRYFFKNNLSKKLMKPRCFRINWRNKFITIIFKSWLRNFVNLKVVGFFLFKNLTRLKKNNFVAFSFSKNAWCHFFHIRKEKSIKYLETKSKFEFFLINQKYWTMEVFCIIFRGGVFKSGVYKSSSEIFSCYNLIDFSVKDFFIKLVLPQYIASIKFFFLNIPYNSLIYTSKGSELKAAGVKTIHWYWFMSFLTPLKM